MRYAHFVNDFYTEETQILTLNEQKNTKKRLTKQRKKAIISAMEKI